MRVTSTVTSRGGHGCVSDSGEVVAFPLACARWRGSQDELVVQRNLRAVKWWRLAMTRVVTIHNGTVVGKAPKIRVRPGRNQGGVGSAREGA